MILYFLVGWYAERKEPSGNAVELPSVLTYAVPLLAVFTLAGLNIQLAIGILVWCLPLILTVGFFWLVFRNA